MHTWLTKETEHYLFHCKAGSLAEKELEQVMAEQEACFREITQTLQLFPRHRIAYWLCNTRRELMQAARIDFETNGVTFIDPEGPEIYAVYDQETKCTGFHEDVHAITCQFALPASSAIVEGLAMFFDKVWWKIPNEVCTRVYMEDGKCHGIAGWIADNAAFFQAPDTVSYPVVGALTAFLINRYGMEKYKALYLDCDDAARRFTQVYGMSLEEAELAFTAFIRSQPFEPDTLAHARQTLYA